jgi:hypothetical protein
VEKKNGCEKCGARFQKKINKHRMKEVEKIEVGGIRETNR